jgi:hypothetical protein
MLKVKEGAWEKPIWTAIEKCFSEDVTKALALPPKERFFRLGWLASVFRITDTGLKNLVDDSKFLTLWLVSGPKLELREGMPNIGDEIPFLPYDIATIVEAITIDFINSNDTSKNFHFQWEGVDSLVRYIDIYNSAPFRSALLWSDTCVSNSLSITRLQLLEPPKDDSALLVQFVATTHERIKEREDSSDFDSALKERKKRLCDPEVKDALLIALANPKKLNPRQRGILNSIFPGSGELPVEFAEPFSKYLVTKDGFFNILHPIGEMVARCLAACYRRARWKYLA